MTELLLASDVERRSAELRLREHFAKGRLTLPELDERLDAVHAAQNRDDLEAALRGLPTFHLGLREHLVLYLAVNAALVVIWALVTPEHPAPTDSGAGTSFWPIWSIVGWGGFLLYLWLRRPSHRRVLGR